jgi:nitroimidazol reductase NimA-like FMN-containing flavoprotein (pyridoxamine 5'-phosphate oxidase superfamily)
MIGELSPLEIEHLLRSQIVGRIGCHDGDSVYVVPISYAYDGDYIYCHSFEGQKLDFMRKSPRVCFQVDEMTDMSNWKSAIAWGEFEELTDRDERKKALEFLLQRRLPIRSSITTHLGQTWPFTGNGNNGINDIPGIVFRIKLQQKTGKCECTTESPILSFN